jgi:hypothetical protein
MSQGHVYTVNQLVTSIIQSERTMTSLAPCPPTHAESTALGHHKSHSALTISAAILRSQIVCSVHETHFVVSSVLRQVFRVYALLLTPYCCEPFRGSNRFMSERSDAQGSSLCAPAMSAIEGSTMPTQPTSAAKSVLICRILCPCSARGSRKGSCHCKVPVRPRRNRRAEFSRIRHQSRCSLIICTAKWPCLTGYFKNIRLHWNLF